MLLHTVVVVVVLVVVVVVVAVVVFAACFVTFMFKAKKCQIGGVHVFFEESRRKKHRKYRIVYASQAQNHGIYGVCLLLVAKTTVFTVFVAST